MHVSCICTVLRRLWWGTRGGCQVPGAGLWAAPGAPAQNPPRMIPDRAKGDQWGLTLSISPGVLDTPVCHQHAAAIAPGTCTYAPCPGTMAWGRMRRRRRGGEEMSPAQPRDLGQPPALTS